MCFQKHPSIGVLTKSCSENMQQIYRRTTVPKCDFNKVTLRHVCSPINLLRVFRTTFYKNTYGGLLLYCLPYIILTKQPGECLKKFLQLKRIVKLQAVWLQIYWKRTSLHVLLRSFTNNISFLYTLLKFRSIYFQGTPLWS